MMVRLLLYCIVSMLIADRHVLGDIEINRLLIYVDLMVIPVGLVSQVSLRDIRTLPEHYAAQLDALN